MQPFLRSIVAGIVSGSLTCITSIYTLGFTSAIAMPRDFPTALWEAVVVFGIGAMLVALLIHFLALREFVARIPLAFAAFVTAGVITLAVTGLLAYGGKVLAAWLIGALLASAVQRRLQSKNSSKRTRERSRTIQLQH